MTRPASNDPLLRLPSERIPEPTPARMNETIAAARQLFAEQRAPGAQEAGMRRRSFFGRAWFGRTWMEAILGTGLVTAACALAFVLSPAFMSTQDIQPEPFPADYPRMGANPTPPMRQLDLDLVADLEPYDFGDLRLGVRNADERFGIYFVQPSGVEQEIVSGPKDQAEAVSVTDAVRLEIDGDDVLLVRSGFDDVQRWDAFVHDGFGFAISGALSRQVWDAAGREEALERLDGS